MADRFSGTQLWIGTAEHLIGVRYKEEIGQWVFDQGLYPDVAAPEIPFTPQPGDRLLARANFGQNSLVPLEGETGEVYGIPQGYSYSDLVFHMNMWRGTDNNGEFWIEGSYFYVGTPPVPPTDVGTLNNGVAFTDTFLGTNPQWYIMYSQTPVATRFASTGAPLHSKGATNLIAVRYRDDNKWVFDCGSWPEIPNPEFEFTPASTDVLVAFVDFDKPTDTRSLQGDNSILYGIQMGYWFGDLRFYEDMWGGGDNDGEVWITGSFFVQHPSEETATPAPNPISPAPTPVPTPPPANLLIDVGPLNRGVAMTDSNLGSKTWYIMYSATKLADRFSGTELWRNTAEHLIGVRYDETNAQWVFDQGLYPDVAAPEIPFVPQEGDRLLARANFATGILTPLKDEIGVLYGIQVGYTYSDLVFHLNMWNGGNNNGEFWIEGSYFFVGTTPVTMEEVGDLGRGVPGTDSIQGEAPQWYIMYSETAIASRFASTGAPLHANGAAHLILVRYKDGNWVFDCGSWPEIPNPEFVFTPVPTDVLVAYIDFGDPSNSRSLQGENGVVNGMTMGYWFGDLYFHTDMWNGGVNIGEVWVTGSSFARNP